MRLLVLLQNAWARPGPLAEKMARDYWYWLRCLRQSQSGKRLEVLFQGDDWLKHRFANTTRLIGEESSSCLKPEPRYIRGLLEAEAPDCILACGKQAENAATLTWPGKLLVIPHPTYRVLTNTLLLRAKELLETGEFERLALRQGRGSVLEEVLS